MRLAPGAALTVGLVQVNWEMPWSNAGEDETRTGPVSLFPYSVGLLRAYAEAHLPAGRICFLDPLFKRAPVSEIAARLEAADVVGFSAYVWNVEVSLAVAAEVKRRRPGTVVVFGGPQVPDDAEAFLRANPAVDVACHGEGEATFTELLARLAEAEGPARAPASLREVAGLSYLGADGTFVRTARRSRIEELDAIPSPYLCGAFDGLLAAHPTERWIASWETNRGCPFSCTFCDWGSATAAKVHTFDLGRLAAEIDWFAAHEIGYLFCCDANFGLLPRDVEIARMLVASRRANGYPFAVSVQNAKNSTERTYEIQHLLASAMHTSGVTLALQSTSRETLQAIRRQNIRPQSYEELQHRYVREGVYTYTDLIIGLPGDTYESFATSVDEVVASGQHDQIQFHNCSVLPNAEMAAPAYRRRFGLSTVLQPIRTEFTPAMDRPEVEELLETVVATSAMPAKDWVRTKCFAWMTNLAYFDRLLQIPIGVLSARSGLGLRTVVEALLDAEGPVLAGIAAGFSERARAIQGGDLEFARGPGSDPLLFPADIAALHRIVTGGGLDAFYAEVRDVLLSLLRRAAGARGAGSGGLLRDAVLVNEALLCNRALLCVPGEHRDLELTLSHDVYGYWEAIRRAGAPGEPGGSATYRVLRAERRFSQPGEYEAFLADSHGFDKRRFLYRVERIAPGATRPSAEPAAARV